MGSPGQALHGAGVNGTTPSGVITSGPTSHDPLTADFSGTTLLAIWAHPDDEAYLGAGLMTAVAAGGGRVISATASLGERGSDDPSAYPPEQLGARRVASLIDELRPEIVCSFGPDGVTGHPDHQAVGRWTAMAVAAQDRPPALVTTSAASVRPDDLVECMHQIGAFLPGYPDDDRRSEDLRVTLTGAALETKLAALHSHRTQIGPLVELLGAADYTRLVSSEAYRPSNAVAAAWLNPSSQARPA